MMNLSVAQLKEALRIKEQIEALEGRLGQILDGGSLTTAATASGKRGRRMSAEGRARIAAAARARWAKLKGNAPSPSKPARKPSSKRGGKLSPEAKAKISEAMRARWAARKKANSQS